MAKRFRAASNRGEALGLLVKRILRKYKWPPDQQEQAVSVILAQAETLSAEWAAFA